MKKDPSKQAGKSALALIAAIIMTLGIAAGCTPAASTTTAAGTDTVTTSAPGAATGAQTTEPGDLELTLEELKQYNGKNGQPAYVAVDGIIYDVSDVEAWPNGEHNGNEAGNDLTDVIKNQSPHGMAALEDVPQVGRIKE